MKHIIFAAILLFVSPTLVEAGSGLLIPVLIAAWLKWGCKEKEKTGEEETDGFQTNHWDREPLPTYPKHGRCQYGEMDFSDAEWDKSGGKITNIFNGVTITQDRYGNWVTDDDPEENGTSDYYGWYKIDD